MNKKQEKEKKIMEEREELKPDGFMYVVCSLIILVGCLIFLCDYKSKGG